MKDKIVCGCGCDEFARTPIFNIDKNSMYHMFVCEKCKKI